MDIKNSDRDLSDIVHSRNTPLNCYVKCMISPGHFFVKCSLSPGGTGIS